MSTPDKEMRYWDSYYEEALRGEGQEFSSSLWWNIADRDLMLLIQKLFSSKEKKVDVLEAGCGSASSSFLLANYLNVDRLTLVDISQKALDFAQIKSKEQKISANLEFIQGSIFDLSPFKNKYDFIWNVGLVEHYHPKDIQKIISEMYGALREGGYLAIGIPNRKSIAVLKAALLGSKFGRKYLRWIKGYRNETEILYSNRDMVRFFQEIDPRFTPKIGYAGSPLWVGAPQGGVQFCDRFLKLKLFSFIVLFILQKREPNESRYSV